jgi:hypothetical protein
MHRARKTSACTYGATVPIAVDRADAMLDLGSDIDG